MRFDESKTVRELIEFAFDEFGYYEPAGMNLVTVFQAHHSQSDYGWFTRDTNRICVEEIENTRELCFAYYLPGVFYYAEGGWCKYIPILGNHPEIPDSVPIELTFEDFWNTIVINGNYRFCDVLNFLKQVQYLPAGCDRMGVIVSASRDTCYRPSSDRIAQTRLIDLKKWSRNTLMSFI